jgi:hypothetical protein
MYKYVLTELGKTIFKGSNKEIMQPTLDKEFNSEAEALGYMRSIGTSNEIVFKLIEVA